MHDCSAFAMQYTIAVYHAEVVCTAIKVCKVCIVVKSCNGSEMQVRRWQTFDFTVGSTEITKEGGRWWGGVKKEEDDE